MIETFLAKQDCRFAWLDLTNPSRDELERVAKQYQLPDALVLDCLEPNHLPKFEFSHGISFVIVRVYHAPESHEADTIQEISTKIALFYTRDLLITVHRRAHPFLAELKHEHQADAHECSTPAELALRLVRHALHTFVRPALLLTRELDSYESEIFLKQEVPNALQGLYFLKRKASSAKQLLLLTRDVLAMLRRQTNGDTTLLHDTQDLQVRVETLYQELDGAATNLVNLYLSLSSQRTNEAMRVLTVFSAFFLPLTFIAGIYGMNFQYMPELGWQLGYPGVLVLMVLVGLGIWVWFKRKGWI
ncbi:magnesium/cobalt transporter CorA [Hymenobacter saemangeumensis]|uniref:Magnesium/cobalt transporter CorA n=1 Tax=Hymenobacter saemangeumensis TaxID=1084522 RepID=A0ABP8IHV9_9BACT